VHLTSLSMHITLTWLTSQLRLLPSPLRCSEIIVINCIIQIITLPYTMFSNLNAAIIACRVLHSCTCTDHIWITGPKPMLRSTLLLAIETPMCHTFTGIYYRVCGCIPFPVLQCMWAHQSRNYCLMKTPLCCETSAISLNRRRQTQSCTQCAIESWIEC